MLNPHAIILAAATGFSSGLILSIPVGPVNLTIMNEGARQGFKYAALVGLGASVMEVIYCSIAFTGFASFLSHGLAKAIIEVFSLIFIMFLGFEFLLGKPPHRRGRVSGRIEKKFHPHSAFMTGFVRVMGNPGILGGWIVLSASFLAHELVQPTWQSKTACVLGIACGTNLWFCGLSYGVSLGQKKFSETTLLWMERISGMGLLLFGIGYGCRIVWQLAKARHGM
ncbi:MAG TPA: LysE family transporter [Verrucomicrobiae bacterium]|nr:LysE family transporter [Verrucomicrobiae bacterium]